MNPGARSPSVSPVCVSLSLATAPEVAGVQFRHVGLRLALQQEQMSQPFGRVARDVVDGRVRFEDA